VMIINVFDVGAIKILNPSPTISSIVRREEQETNEMVLRSAALATMLRTNTTMFVDGSNLGPNKIWTIMEINFDEYGN